MADWTTNKLNKIGSADELEIASLRADDTLQKPVTIWVVRVGDDLFVRSVRGRESGWFRGVAVRHEGQIQAGGVTKDVNFEEVGADDPVNRQIDTAYTSKYSRYNKKFVDPTLTSQALSATIKLVPR